MFGKKNLNLFRKTNFYLKNTQLSGKLWRSTFIGKDVVQHVENLGEESILPKTIEKPVFGDTKEAYKCKTFRDLLRAYLVFTACSKDFLVDKQMELLDVTQKVLGTKLFKKVMCSTVYGQFMAGEKSTDVLKRVEKNKHFGVLSMFAYTAPETHAYKKGAKSDIEKICDPTLQWNENLRSLLDCIEMASSSVGPDDPYPKLSFKYTFLQDAELLRAVTTLINKNEDFLLNQTDDTDHLFTQTIEESEKISRETGIPMPKTDKAKDTYLRSLKTNLPFNLALSEMRGEGLDSKKKEGLFQLWRTMEILAQKGSLKKTVLLIDAEQTYLQLAIDLITLDLMRKYNKKRPVVHNTYQCYLKRTHDIVVRDIDLAKAEGFCWGGKIVRGAYLDEERRLAKDKQYDDPVNNDYEATTSMYHQVADTALTEIKKTLPGKLQVTFATHNLDTIQYVLQRMQEKNVDIDGNVVGFGQLLGMRDHITFPLGQAGYPASKLLHYGEILGGIAYLSRRVQENRSGIATADIERKMLGKEIKRRLFMRS